MEKLWGGGANKTNSKSEEKAISPWRVPMALRGRRGKEEKEICLVEGGKNSNHN